MVVSEAWYEYPPPPSRECPAAQGVDVQSVDVQIGRDRSDRYDRDRRRNDATVGIGPGGVTIGPRQRCRMVTIWLDLGFWDVQHPLGATSAASPSTTRTIVPTAVRATSS